MPDGGYVTSDGRFRIERAGWEHTRVKRGDSHNGVAAKWRVRDRLGRMPTLDDLRGLPAARAAIEAWAAGERAAGPHRRRQ